MSNSDAITARTMMGERSASDLLAEMYLLHREPVFRYLRARTGDDDVAIDLTALTFERAFGQLRRDRQVGLGWLLRTARNAAIDADRRSRTAARFGCTHEQVPL